MGRLVLHSPVSSTENSRSQKPVLLSAIHVRSPEEHEHSSLVTADEKFLPVDPRTHLAHLYNVLSSHYSS